LATSQTRRAAIVSLLPDPAPAITAIGASGAPITAACSGVGSGMRSSRATCRGVYRTRIPRSVPVTLSLHQTRLTFRLASAAF
jgi:hypothetical protein